jgi:hypothetical protein
MSAALLARARAAERVVQRWSRDSYWEARRAGRSRGIARYYSDRRTCWPDALTMVREGRV